jgi:hypothetical protein
VVCVDVRFRYRVTKPEKNDLEQCYAMKFCVKLRDGASDTYEKIQKAFGNDSLSYAQIIRWHEDFLNGRETVKYAPCSGRLASVRSTNVEPVRSFIG